MAIPVNSVHCLNPVARFAHREIDRICGFCGEAVIRNLGADGRQSGGDTPMVATAERKTPGTVLSATMCEEKKG